MIPSSDREFCAMVRYFYEEKGDPTRYVEWDAERCRRLMPMFFDALTQLRHYKAVAHLAVRAEAEDSP